jgi:hypothetical protein
MGQRLQIEWQQTADQLSFFISGNVIRIGKYDCKPSGIWEWIHDALFASALP